MIIDFNRININEREQMMGGDRINDVALNTPLIPNVQVLERVRTSIDRLKWHLFSFTEHPCWCKKCCTHTLARTPNTHRPKVLGEKERRRKVKNHIDKPANLITISFQVYECILACCSVLPLNGTAFQMNKSAPAHTTIHFQHNRVHPQIPFITGHTNNFVPKT